MAGRRQAALHSGASAGLLLLGAAGLSWWGTSPPSPPSLPLRLPRQGPSFCFRLQPLYEKWLILLAEEYNTRMGVRSMDQDWNHLFPLFREKLRKVLEEIEGVTGEPWILMEGYRSAERQKYLYEQGRTRPGPVITWMRTPKYHGTGLAADCYPQRRSYQAPQAYFERYRGIYIRHGLSNPAWTNGDRGHVQLSNETVRQRALAWVRAGFQDPQVKSPAVTVKYQDAVIPDADAYLENGHVYVKLRPVADALDFTILETKKVGGLWRARLLSDHAQLDVPMVLKDGSGFAWVNHLPCNVVWLNDSKTLILKGTP